MPNSSLPAYEEFVGDTPVNGNHTPVNGNYTPVSGNYTSVFINYKQGTRQRQAFSYNDKFKRTYFANNYL